MSVNPSGLAGLVLRILALPTHALQLQSWLHWLLKMPFCLLSTVANSYATWLLCTHVHAPDNYVALCSAHQWLNVGHREFARTPKSPGKADSRRSNAKRKVKACIFLQCIEWEMISAAPMHLFCCIARNQLLQGIVPFPIDGHIM